MARARLRRGRCLEAREALRFGLEQCPEAPALLQLGKEIDKALQQMAKRQEESLSK